MKEKNQFGQILGKRLENFRLAIRPIKADICGRYCIIENLDIYKHSQELFSALQFENQGESWTYLPYGPFDSEEEFRAWLEKIAIDEADTMLYAILDIKTKKPIGMCGYLRIN